MKTTFFFLTLCLVCITLHYVSADDDVDLNDDINDEINDEALDEDEDRQRFRGRARGFAGRGRFGRGRFVGRGRFGVGRFAGRGRFGRGRFIGRGLGGRGWGVGRVWGGRRFVGGVWNTGWVDPDYYDYGDGAALLGDQPESCPLKNIVKMPDGTLQCCDDKKCVPISSKIDEFPDFDDLDDLDDAI